jgi:hypothetical protein
MKTAEGEVACTTGTSLESWVLLIRQDTKWTKRFGALKEHTVAIASQLGASDYVCCIEICPRTFFDHNVCRLHAHVFLRSPSKMSQPPLRDLAFEGVVPQMCAVLAGMPMSRQSHSWCGYFYCCVEKEGHITSWGNRKPFRDFLVNSSWISHLLQGEKISVEYARRLLYQSCTSIARYEKEFQLIAREREHLRVQATVERAERILQASQKPWKKYALIDSWLAQYQQDAFRYKFLVLEGPSRVGKTRFAKGLCESATHVLELSCAAGVEPDLRHFRYGTHRLCCWTKCPQV